MSQEVFDRWIEGKASSWDLVKIYQAGYITETQLRLELGLVYPRNYCWIGQI